MCDWTDPSLVLLAGASGNSNDNYSWQEAVVSEVILFWFDLKTKFFFFPPVLSLLYVIWYLIFWVHPKSSPILLKKITGLKKNSFFWKCLIITRQTTCLLLLLGRIPGILPWSLLSKWAHLKLTKRNTKQSHVWLAVSADHNPTSNGMSVGF